VEQAVKYSPECILMVVTNPLDAMCHVAYHVSGFPKHRVVGMAGVLDTARFRTFVAQALNVSASDVVAFVLGGHGDTMAPLVRYSSVAGIPLADLMDADTLQGIEKIYEAKLTKDELVALHKSAAAVKELVDVMAPKLA
jgi:malate dehydrogenase